MYINHTVQEKVYSSFSIKISFVEEEIILVLVHIVLSMVIAAGHVL